VDGERVSPGDRIVETNSAPAVVPEADVSIPRPWEKQPWESIVSFTRFATYHLSQEAPRSIPEAYRAYRRAIGALEGS